MDNVTYSLTKKIAASALSGVQSMSVSGQTLTINTKDSGVLTMTFPKPRDGVSITDIDVNANNQIVFTMSDGTEFISGKIPTVKGDPFKYSDFTTEQLESLKGADGFSPTITENADNTDKIYKLDITTADSTFTTPNLKGADGQGGSGGTVDVPIEKIKVNGELQTPVNKVVDITVPSIEGLTKDSDLSTVAKSGDYEDLSNKPTIPSLDGYAKTSEIPSKVSQLENDSNYLSSIPEEYVTDTELSAKGYLTEHQDISGKVDKVDGKSLISDTEIERLASVDNYDDTQVKTAIQAVANGLMDSVGYSADYKTIDIIAKNGVKKSVNVAPIISHASITELSDVDTTNKATGKALVYNATTNKHEYADVSGTDEKVKMDASTDAKYLGELLDNITIANENGKLKVKKLDGQEVTITEINYLKGLTMNVMDLVNMFSNGGVKIINTPVATYAELLTLDKSSFIEGISYLVYVLADENHDNAKTTYLVDKDSETPTYFGFADSQRDFTTNPIDLATEITGKLGISNMDSDAIKALFTVDDTYKTETATNNAFSTHGAKALYDELLLAIGNKANASDLTDHKDDTDIHVSTEDRTNWDSAKTHADSAHAPSNAQANVLETVKVNGTVLEISDKAVNVTVPTTVSELTDSADYAKKTDLHSHDNKSVLDGITSDKVTYWDNKSEFSGSYNDLNDKPTIDAELSNTSENAIQNKVVTKEINKLYSDISFNDFDTATDGISFTDAEDGNMLVTDCTRNLLNPTLETVTENGVTCTRNVDANGKPDGTYTLNGTATDNFNLYLCEPEFTKLTKGEEYRAILYSNILNGLGFDITNNINEGHHSDEIYGYNFICNEDEYPYGCSILIRSGTVFNNILIKPMLTTDLNATYDDFVPYGGYEIQSCGKNLMSVNDFSNGATLDTQDRFNIRIRGLDKGNIVSDRIYLLKNAVTEGHKSFTFKVTIDEPYGIAIKHNGSTKDIDIEYINYMVRKGTYTISFDVASNNPSVEGGLLLHNIQLEHGDTETDFEPYQDGGIVNVDYATEFPLLGLKSFDGITNIISPANVKCVYPTNESGKVITNAINGKQDVLLDTVSGVKAKFTLENGIICVREI